MNLTRLSPFVLHAALIAQGAAPPPPAADMVAANLQRGLAADQVLFDAPGDGSVWAVTARYKAGFDQRGLQFVPFLGSRASRNFPVHFMLDGVRRGDAAVPVRAAGAPELRDRVVTLDHGTLLERYAVTAEGVEQTFVLGAPLAGSGDLVVRVRVTTELTPQPLAAGISFANELGRVTYGEAFLVDAADARTPLAQRYADGCLELRVPATALVGAAYPVTIDPVITAFPVASTPTVEHEPDLVFEGASNRYLVVWEHDFSATDHDIYSQMFETDGTPVPNSFQAIDATTLHWTRPRCAVAGGYALVVASRGQVGRRQVAARQLYVPQIGVIGDQFSIAINRVGWHEVLNPDVGGTTPAVGGGRWLVVYEKSEVDIGRSIVGQLVQNQLLAGPAFTIDPYGDAHNPAIARSTGDAPAIDAGWPVVWQRYRTDVDDDIWGAVVATNGSLMRPVFPVDTSARNDTNPSVSTITDPMHGERMFVVAYEGAIGPSDRDIFVRALSVSGAVAIGATNISALDAGSRARDQLRPHLDTDGCRFALAYAEQRDPANHDICAWTLGIDYGQVFSVSEGKLGIAFGSANEVGARVFAHHSAEPFDNRTRYGIVFERGGDIAAVNYAGHGPGGYSVRATGCSGLGIAPGPRPVIGGTVSVSLQNAGVDACVILMGPAANLSLGCAPCALGVDPGGALVVVARYLSLDVPYDSAYVGLRFAMQGASVGSGYPCSGGLVRFSDTVDVTIQ